MREEPYIENGIAHVDGEEYRYIDPLSDRGFKIIFGNDRYKDNLIKLLNALHPNRNIINLHYLNTEQIPRYESEKKSVFDVMCEADDGSKFVVEMQKVSKEYFRERVLYYSTFVVQQQSRRGKDWQYELRPTVMVSILGYIQFSPEESAGISEPGLHHYSIRNDENGALMTDSLHFTFVEVPYAPKTISKDSTIVEKLLYLLQNLMTMKQRADIFDEPFYRNFFEAAELGGMSQDDFNSYIREMREERDRRCELSFAKKEAQRIGREEGREEGRKEGREEGREEGRKEGILAMAKKMKEQGISIDDIVKISGFTKEQVEIL